MIMNLSSITTVQLWNVITMNENQLSKEIARASKRDSTVMSAITVGTLFFFPGTFVAVSVSTMLAIPGLEKPRAVFTRPLLC